MRVGPECPGLVDCGRAALHPAGREDLRCLRVEARVLAEFFADSSSDFFR